MTEIAERVSLPKSTVSRLLSTLEGLGAVEQVSAGGGYRIGLGLLELSAAVQPGRSLVSVARPHLVELSRRTGDAAGISIPDGTDMLYLDQVTPASELQVRDWTGHRIPMHAVPSGHVVLAADGEVLQRLLEAPLRRFTDHTITSPEALHERLDLVRRKGWAWALEEFADGMNSVAAAVRGADGRVVAALHVYGPATHLPGGRDMDEVGQLLVDTARKIRID